MVSKYNIIAKLLFTDYILLFMTRKVNEYNLKIYIFILHDILYRTDECVIYEIVTKNAGVSFVLRIIFWMRFKTIRKMPLHERFCKML